MKSLKNEDGTYDPVIYATMGNGVVVKRYLKEILPDGKPHYVAKKPAPKTTAQAILEESINRLRGFGSIER